MKAIRDYQAKMDERLPTLWREGAGGLRQGGYDTFAISHVRRIALPRHAPSMTSSVPVT